MDIGSGLIAIGAAAAVGLAGIGAGIAEGPIGVAAIGAIAEDPKKFGLAKGLLFLAIPETIVIFGLVIAFILYAQIA